MKMRLELVPVPVTDIDRAKDFFVSGFGFDVDVTPADGVRIVQLTPPGSACSIVLSRGLPVLDGNTFVLQEMPWRTGDAF